MNENWEEHWKDYYKTLQLDPSAEPEVIKGAFDRLARKYHPDVNKAPSAHERMKALNEAFETLGNPEKRILYDITWHERQKKSVPSVRTTVQPRPEAEKEPPSGPATEQRPAIKPRAGRRFGFSFWVKVLVIAGLAIAAFFIAKNSLNMNSVPNIPPGSTSTTPGVTENYTQLWNYKLDKNDSWVSMSADGSHVNVATYSGIIYFLDNQGQQIQSYDINQDFSFAKSISVQPIWNIPPTFPYQIVYVHAFDYTDTSEMQPVLNFIYVFTYEGKLFWRYDMGNTWGVGFAPDVCFSNDGMSIAIGARIGNPQDATLRSRIHLLTYRGDRLWGDELTTIAYATRMSSDGSYIVAGGTDNKVYLFSNTGDLLWSRELSSEVDRVSIASDGSYVIAGTSKDGMIYAFSRKGDNIWSYSTNTSIGGIQISPDDANIIIKSGETTGGDVKTLYTFNNKGEPLWSYESIYGIGDTIISPDNTCIAIEDGNILALLDYKGKTLWSYTLDENEHIRKMVFSRDSNFIAVGSGISDTNKNGKVYFFDREGRLLWSSTTDSWVQSLALSADSVYVAAGCISGEAYFYVSLSAM
jgi:hypothetical protein